MIVHIPPGLSQFFYESYCTLIEYNVCMFFILSHGAFTLQRGASRAPHSRSCSSSRPRPTFFRGSSVVQQLYFHEVPLCVTTCRHLWHWKYTSDHRFLILVLLPPKRHYEDMPQEAPKGVSVYTAKTSHPPCCSAA